MIRATVGILAGTGRKPVALAATGVGETSFTANWEAYPDVVYYLLDVSTQEDFSTFVYENEVVNAPATSYVVIGLEDDTTYYYRLRASTEPLYLLDEWQYPGSAAAYSLRKLKHDYEGDAIRVRVDTTGQPEYEIGFVDGELDVATLEGYCTGGLDAYVDTWYDQSGNGYDASQTTASNQPQIVSSGSVITDNGKPAVDFDGTDDNLKSAVFTSISQPFTLFLVNQWIGLTSFKYLIDLGGDRALGYLNASGTNGMYFGAGINSAVSPSTSVTQLWYALANASSSEISINNETVITGNAGTRDASSVTIGSYFQNNYFANSYISEFIFYPSDQSSNRTGIQTNINDFYNIYT